MLLLQPGSDLLHLLHLHQRCCVDVRLALLWTDRGTRVLLLRRRSTTTASTSKLR